MKLIVCLGNPGEKYKNNRHNVGFMFADFVTEHLQKTNLHTENQAFITNTYLMSSISHFKLEKEEIILAKPNTFMNKSGEAVKKLVQKYLGGNHEQILQDLIVVHDDLDIPLGKFRIVKGYGPKLHNGIESIENHLHEKDFTRIRIGVDARSPDNRIPGIEYVLQDFQSTEKTILLNSFPGLITLLQTEYQIFES